jgi:inosose dehydratase
VTGSLPSPIRIAATPTNFGVQRVLPPKASTPDPLAVLDVVANLGYDGISLGPPGYLGEGEVLRERLAARRLRLAEAFLPLHFSRADVFAEEREGLRATLARLSKVTNEGERPIAVLSEGFREPTRWSSAGRAISSVDPSLPPERFRTMITNLHRAAEDCLDAGFEPTLHHHAGTFIETDDEIRRVFDAVDPALLGMCLDTAHACLGHSDPLGLVRDYHSMIRNVHLKDVSFGIVGISHAKEQDLTELTIEGAFVPLGQGDVAIADVLMALASYGYRGWMIIEHDRFLFDDGQLQDAVDDQRRNIEFVKRLVEPRCGSPA